MPIRRLVPVLLAVLLAAVPAARASIFDYLTGHRDIEVITVTDMTPEGRLVAAPTAQAPAYYISVSLGFKDLGPVGGDKSPPEDQVLATIQKALAKQHFLPAGPGTPPPTLALAFTWGTLNADFDYGFDPDKPPRLRNRQQILKFMGGYKMGYSDRDFDAATAVTGLKIFDFDSQAFYDLAEEDFFVAVISAYDLKAFQAKQKKLLWMTRISTPSTGFGMKDVFPTMLAVATPNLGRETERPVWIDASDKYKPDVKLGETQVIGVIEDRKTPPSATEPDKKKPPAPAPTVSKP